MTPEQLALLRAAAEKATPGPWHAPGLGEVHMPSHDCVAQICFKHDFADEDELFGTEADAQHIAAANPATILALLDHIDQVERENAALRQTLSECATAVEATAAPQCSVEFMAGIPAEVKARLEQVRASTIEECAKVSRLTQLGKGGPERKAIEDCIHEIRALALPAAPNEEKPT